MPDYPDYSVIVFSVAPVPPAPVAPAYWPTLCMKEPPALVPASPAPPTYCTRNPAPPGQTMLPDPARPGPPRSDRAQTGKAPYYSRPRYSGYRWPARGRKRRWPLDDARIHARDFLCYTTRNSIRHQIG